MEKPTDIYQQVKKKRNLIFILKIYFPLFPNSNNFV